MKIFSEDYNCCGCTACESICPKNAIKMVEDFKGFKYPQIDINLCIDCGLCKDICDFQKPHDKENTPVVYAVKHKNDNVLKHSTSGGAFTLFSDYFLENRNIVYGVKLDKNLNGVHSRAATKSERDEFRGSKYIQSDISSIYKLIIEDLKDDKKVLFTGTPCQVGALNSFLDKRKMCKDNLYTMDFFCHGTPSKKIFKDYIQAEEQKRKIKILDVSFRNKVNGWTKTSFTFNNSIIAKSGTEVFYSLFWSHNILRNSCHSCPYTTNHVSDITIFDYWGIDKVMPEFFDEKGVSGLWLNTDKANKLFDLVKENVDYKESTKEDSQRFNIKSPPKPKAEKEQFWVDYKNHGYDYIAKKYAGQSFKGKARALIKNILLKMHLSSIVEKFQKVK